MVDFYGLYVATLEVVVVLFAGMVAIAIAQRWRP